MLLHGIGHAGLRVQGAEGTVVVDPWFSPQGAFLGSWFQYPSNEHLLQSDLLDPDAILISHEHLDHVDAWFLSMVPGHVPVYVPRYPSPALCAKIRAGGERPIYELDEWDEHEVAPGIRAFFVSEESPMNHDSAMVVRVGDESLLNLNDARLTPGQLRRVRSAVGGTVEIVAVQGAGASWYPVCYRYDEEHKRELSRRKREAKLRYVAKVFDIVEPELMLPFAGPPAFLDAELRFANAEMGPDGIFPDQQQVVDWLADTAGIVATEVLLPGDSWHTTEGAQRDEHWSEFSYRDREAYLDEYAVRRAGEIEAVKHRHSPPTRDLYEDFRAYFDRTLAMSRYFNEQIDMKVGFEILGPGGGRWSVDFRAGSEGISRNIDGCQYTYRFESRWLPAILAGKVPWEDFFLSLRFEAWRDPDLYNDHLLGLLKFAWPDALDAVEAYESATENPDTIDISIDGVVYRVERYCPHARQDLAESGEVLPGGILRCLGHHYEFDLATGECITGRSRPLATQVVEVDDRTPKRTAPVSGPSNSPAPSPGSSAPPASGTGGP